jgi:hypothetical protein
MFIGKDDPSMREMEAEMEARGLFGGRSSWHCGISTLGKLSFVHLQHLFPATL